MLCVLKRPCRLVRDGRHFTIHIEQLAFIQGETFHDVLKRVRVDGFFECLAEKILAAFGICKMAINREHDVVRDEGLGRREEAEIALDRTALVRREAVGAFPECDVGLHGDFCRHPVVVAAGKYFSHAQRYFNGRS